MGLKTNLKFIKIGLTATISPVFIDDLVPEELHAHHGHEAQPHHQRHANNDAKLQGCLQSLLSWNWLILFYWF